MYIFFTHFRSVEWSLILGVAYIIILQYTDLRALETQFTIPIVAITSLLEHTAAGYYTYL